MPPYKQPVWTRVNDDFDYVDYEHYVPDVMKMELTLRGNIYGNSEDSVREWIEENLPSYKLTNIGAQYDSLVIDDEVLSDLDIEAE